LSLLRHPDIRISIEEVEYYKGRIQINTIQTNMLFLFLARRVGRYNALYNLRFGEYVIALAFFRKWLLANGFEFLSRWITATFPPEVADKKRIVNNRELASDLIRSKAFQYLSDVKYAGVMGNITRHNVIAKSIATIYTNSSLYLPSYEESVSGEPEPSSEEFEGVGLDKITDEVLRFIESI
jgi:hypothetical protein